MTDDSRNDSAKPTSPIPPVPQDTEAPVPPARFSTQDQGQDSIPSSPVIPPEQVKQRKPSRVPMFLMGLFGVLIGCALGAGVVWGIVSYSMGESSSSDTAGLIQESDSPSNTTSITVDNDDETIAEAVAAKDIESVVSVECTYATASPYSYYYSDSSTTESGLGSGCIISSDGYILTNYHIVDGATAISVTIDGTTYEATVVGGDASSDLAVIKIDASGLTAFEMGDSDALTTGEWVMTIGSPFGLEQSCSTGIVSALYRSTTMVSETGETIYANMIQTDASINPGNSGGALVDSEGKLIGITTLFSSYSGSSSNVGFAIPINYAYRIAEQIINGETVTHAYLGVGLSTVTEDVAQHYNLSVDSGAYVTEVYSGTAAANAGFEAGDIITAVDGSQVDSADGLIIAVRSHEPGDTVQITYDRNGQKNTVSVTLGSDVEDSAGTDDAVVDTGSSTNGTNQ